MSERIVTNPAQMAANWRVAMSWLANLFVTMHRTLSTPMALGPTELLVYAKIVAKVGIKRVIFAVNVPIEESGDGVTFTSAVETLAAANIQYTIFKFGETRKIGEAKYPYRIVGGEMALPKEGNDILSSDDLTRVSQRNESKHSNKFI